MKIVLFKSAPGRLDTDIGNVIREHNVNGTTLLTLSHSAIPLADSFVYDVVMIFKEPSDA